MRLIHSTIMMCSSMMSKLSLTCMMTNIAGCKLTFHHINYLVISYLKQTINTSPLVLVLNNLTNVQDRRNAQSELIQLLAATFYLWNS